MDLATVLMYTTTYSSLPPFWETVTSLQETQTQAFLCVLWRPQLVPNATNIILEATTAQEAVHLRRELRGIRGPLTPGCGGTHHYPKPWKVEAGL